MGIPGLMSYITNQSDRFIQYHELHDCHLVIDGNSVACQLYTRIAKFYCSFGGDYDVYARCVSQFFDDLLKCNVTPLVLFDGGIENKKFKTILQRTERKVSLATIKSPAVQGRAEVLFPLFQSAVFLRVLMEKNIPHAQCLLEADSTIAAVARTLNCPVLSFDSDFYIYGVLFIPFSTLDRRIVQSGGGYVKRCQIYKVEHLVDSIPGLDKALLPLAAVLLGNDYVERRTFANFYRQMKLPGGKSKKFSYRHHCIDTTLRWLGRYTLDEAVIAILHRIPKEKRKEILEVIENNINGYTNASVEILIILGFSKEEVTKMKTHSINRTFKFDGDIENLTYIEETTINDSDPNEEEEDEEIVELASEYECNSTLENFSNLPTWFIDEYQKGRLDPCMINLMQSKFYICPVQIEDNSYPSTIECSLKIISVIYGLLTSGRRRNKSSLTYLARGNGQKLVRSSLERTDTMCGRKFPSLHKLRNLPLSTRKAILLETLGIADGDLLDQFPSQWMLYIATAKYWIDQQQENLFIFRCCMYCILFCMLFNVIDLRIGRYRVLSTFQRKNQSKIDKIQQNRKKANYQASHKSNISAALALSRISYIDCLLAAPYFITQFQVDKQLLQNPKEFNRTIVHMFSTFQACLLYSMHLNALLGSPYEQCNIARLYNGTMLYNLYMDFNRCRDIKTYISKRLQDSPSLLRLFNVILTKAEPLFPILLKHSGNRYKQKRKQKHGVRSQNRPAPTDEPSGEAEILPSLNSDEIAVFNAVLLLYKQYVQASGHHMQSG